MIIEDQFVISEMIISALEDFGFINTLVASSYAEALQKIKTEQPDFLIIDIELDGKKSGIDLAHIVNQNHQIPFIYLTGNTNRNVLNYAKLTNPYAILIKPFNPHELCTSIDLALYKYAQQNIKPSQNINQVINQCIFVKEKDGFKRLNFSDILYIQSDSVYLEIKTTDGNTYITRASISEFISKLNPGFVRIHRKYIVNTNYIDKVNASYIDLQGVILSIGQTYKAGLFHILNLA